MEACGRSTRSRSAKRPCARPSRATPATCAGLAAAAGPQTRSAVATVLDQAAPTTPPGPDPLGFLRELSDEWKLTSPGGPAGADPFSAEPSPSVAGRNLLYEEIGRGGMGCV